MNAKQVALTQADILGILQDANSVPLGQPIFNSAEEFNKLKAIIESAIRYTHVAKKPLTDGEIKLVASFYQIQGEVLDFANGLLNKANEK